MCLSLRSLYCLKSWTSCSAIQPHEQLCIDGKCQNAIKRIRYLIFHNGISGINNIDVYFELANVSRSFYQYFETVFEWTTEFGKSRYSRSGNPGYTIGNPIFIGSAVSNMTNDLEKQYLSINELSYYLTAPRRYKHKFCDLKNRHVIGFGKNVRLQCSVQLITKNFSSLTCINLQEQSLKLMIKDYMSNVLEFKRHKIFASKIGDSSSNDTSSWIQILLDKLPRNVVTGQIIGDKIHCSGLVTSMHIEILHTILPNKNENSEYYKLAGVGFMFSKPKGIDWAKCRLKNCSDVLKVELTSIVSFTDVSKSSVYYYAKGPNLNINLPHDFFYPFISNSKNKLLSEVFLIITSISFCFIPCRV